MSYKSICVNGRVVKAKDLRSFDCKIAWVRTPLDALLFFFGFFLGFYFRISDLYKTAEKVFFNEKYVKLRYFYNN